MAGPNKPVVKQEPRPEVAEAQKLAALGAPAPAPLAELQPKPAGTLHSDPPEWHMPEKVIQRTRELYIANYAWVREHQGGMTTDATAQVAARLTMAMVGMATIGIID